MPGRLFLTRDLSQVAAALQVPHVPADPPRENIAPGQNVIALTTAGAVHMRWGMIPVGRVNARGRPVMETIINARSETVFDKSAFDGVGRSVVPADGWYEWTGEKRRKTPWRITRKDGELLFFAAIYDVWQGPGGMQVHQVATITTEPNADVRGIHHRMGAILAPDEVQTWLHDDTRAGQALLRPMPDNSLLVASASGVDWTGA